MDITPVIPLISQVGLNILHVGHIVNNWGLYFCVILLLGGVSTVWLLLTIIGKLDKLLERMK